MSISDFGDQYAINAIFIAEIEAGVDLTGYSWSASSGDLYSTEYADREIVGVEYLGSALLRVYSIADCEANPFSFYHQASSGRLYVNLYGADPEASGSAIVALVMLCFCDRIGSELAVSFIPEGATQRHLYEPLLDPASIPMFRQMVSDYYTMAVTIQSGTIAFRGGPWWWENRGAFLWHNCRAWVRWGEAGDAYADFELIFTGLTRAPEFTDQAIRIRLRDIRSAELGSIPGQKMTRLVYPDLGDEFVNHPEPVLLGQKENVPPVPLGWQTGGWRYKISRTVFDGVTFDLHALDKVYVGGDRIYSPADYAVDLSTGILTIYEDPGDREVTVDVQGLEISFDFEASGEPAASGFSENVADLLYFALRYLCDIPYTRVDLDSFQALKTARTQRIAVYIDHTIGAIDFIRALQASTIFHLIPTVDSNYMVRYYDRVTPTDAMRFFTEDFLEMGIEEDTEGTFYEIRLMYDRDPQTDRWNVATATNDATRYLYKSKEVLEVETYLKDSSEAEALAQFFLGLVDEPPLRLSGRLPARALASIPTDKIVVERTIKNISGNTVTPLSQAVYLLLEISKDIRSGSMQFRAIADSQVGGTGLHGDTAHTDTHGDDSHADTAHTDVSHADVAHEDVAYDDYRDHTDDAHQDTPYDDHDDYVYSDSHTDYHEDHDDGVYEDAHGDEHSDQAGYNDHDDTAHANVAYDDYTDHDNVAHNDVSHDDVSHEDIAHIDENHDDEHGDQPHADSEV